MAYVSGELKNIYFDPVEGRCRSSEQISNRNPDVIPEPAHASSSIEGISLQIHNLFSYCVWQMCGLILSDYFLGYVNFRSIALWTRKIYEMW